MTEGGLVLALVGVASWGAVLAAAGPRRSIYRTVVEAVAAHAVVATLVSVALVSAGVFRVATAQALAAAVPLLILLVSRRRPWGALKDAPLATRFELVALLLLILVAPMAVPRMAVLYFEDDAGVYSNRAIHHLHEGTLIGEIPVREQLKGQARERFDEDNLYRDRVYRRGTTPVRPGTSDFVFQFLPGWPMLMAQWGGLFGLTRMFDAVLFAFAMAAILFAFLLEEAGLGLVAYVTTVGLFVSSPLLLYFSKYPTSEAFLLFLFLLILYLLDQDDLIRAALAAAAFLVIVVTHISVFAYSPLVLLVALEAYRSASRPRAVFSAAAFGALLLSLPLSLFFSPLYVQFMYQAIFGRLGVADAYRAGFLIVTAFDLVGLAISVAALRRSLSAGGPVPWLEAWVSRGRALAPVALRALLLLLAASIAYRAYLLGWTDHFAHLRAVGAWAARKHYVSAGWEALARLNIVSMVMATALVGLPLALALVFRDGRRACARPRWAVLLAGVLLSLGIFGVVRFDMPYNYYPSRYFLPVFVPSAMLLFGHLVGAFRVHARWVALLALVGLGFNLPFAFALAASRPYSDEMRFVEDVADRVGEHRVLFTRNLWRANRTTRRLLGFTLAHGHGISQISVLRRKDAPAREAMARYARQLGLRDAAVLSFRPPRDGRSFSTVTLVKRRLGRARFYPYRGTKQVLRFYLYNVRFDQRTGRVLEPGAEPSS